MTRIITVTSAKGGVGKTTFTTNLAAALTNLGKKVIIVDGNVTTPNIGLHLGMPLTRNSLHDVLKGEKNVSDVIYPHVSGYSVIPASLAVSDLIGADISKLPEVSFKLLGRADFVIIDSSAGIGKEALSALSAGNETIVVTNPELPSVTDALKIVQIAKSTGIKVLGVAVNKITGLSHELGSEEIEDILEVPVIAEIPYDINIPVSITKKKPLVEMNIESPASHAIMMLAARLSGTTYSPPKRKFRGVFARFFDIFRLG
jgi:septum site-determining protein MinD